MYIVRLKHRGPRHYTAPMQAVVICGRRVLGVRYPQLPIVESTCGPFPHRESAECAADEARVQIGMVSVQVEEV